MLITAAKALLVVLWVITLIVIIGKQGYKSSWLRKFQFSLRQIRACSVSLLQKTTLADFLWILWKLYSREGFVNQMILIHSLLRPKGCFSGSRTAVQIFFLYSASLFWKKLLPSKAAEGMTVIDQHDQLQKVLDLPVNSPNTCWRMA